MYDSIRINATGQNTISRAVILQIIFKIIQSKTILLLKGDQFAFFPCRGKGVDALFIQAVTFF